LHRFTFLREITHPMKIPRWTFRAAALMLGLVAGATQLHAQGVTTGAIAGTVTDAAGAAVEGAVVMAVAKSNGFSTSTTTRSNGYYVIPNLETGAYTVKVRRIGYESMELPVPVTLSQTTRFDIQLKQAATTLGAVTVTATTDASDFNPTRQGVSTQVSDSLISHMPQLNRNITDLAKLVPQVVIPSSGGPSAGGQWNRLNNFSVDGASQNDRFNLNSSGGIPGGAGNGRVISADAVKEFRVLLTPTDVRQANFTGMLFNAVTKSGSNEFHGGIMYNYRHDANMASANFRATPVDQRQYGFQLGGPIIKDRLTFYVAPEWQTRLSSASGAFVGSTLTATTPNISPDSIALVQSIVQSKMGFDPGTSGKVDLENPLTNLFGRVDFQLNSQHRMVVRRTDNTTRSTSFSRNNNTFTNTVTTQTTGFRLGSNGFTGENRNTSNVAQIFSNLTNGISNEFLIGFNKIKDERILNSGQMYPEMAVGVVPVGATGSAATNPTAAITFGSEQFSPFNLAKQDIIEYQDNVSIPYGAHTFTLGGRFETVKIYNNFPQALAGVWRFANIAALNSLTPSGYAVGIPNSGNLADVPAVFKTNMPSAYLQDQFTQGRLTVTAGIRADMPRFVSDPLDNQVFDNQFRQGVLARGSTANYTYTGPTDVSTAWMPKDRVLWSPRIGFNYDLTGDQTNQVRGNVGIYTAPPPFILVANALQNNGLGLVLLSCTTAATIPAFTADVNNLPKSCAGQQPPAVGASPTNTINLNDPNFRYPQALGISGGADRRLPFGFIGTLEAMYKKNINGARIRDLNLLHPALNADGSVKVDRNGRVLYADSILLTGAVINANQKALNVYQTSTINPNTNLPQTATTNFDQGVIYVTNESKSYNYNLTGQLKRRFGNLDWTGAYTYTRSFDVQSLTSDRAISNWRFGREYSVNEDADNLSTSGFERRHRLVTYGTLVVPWTSKISTDFTLFYQGISGSPVTYIASLDLNGDGQANDPIYVPTNSLDTAQIRIGSLTGASATNPGTFTRDDAAALAFDSFISKQSCLNEQRGTIMKRNSCRGPWQNSMDLSIRQALRNFCGIGCENLSVQLDVANVMNVAGELLQHVDGVARDWGKTYGATISANPQQTVLSGNTSSGSSARTQGPYLQSQPVYTFNTTARNQGPFNFAGNTGYNLALTLRYSF
jgi:hypothetical protein